MGKLILFGLKLNTRRGLVHMVTFLADIRRRNESEKVPFIHNPHIHTLQIPEVVCGALLRSYLGISHRLLYSLITGVSCDHKEVNQRLWVHIYDPSTDIQRQAGPEDALARQPSGTGKLQVQWETLSLKLMWEVA